VSRVNAIFPLALFHHTSVNVATGFDPIFTPVPVHVTTHVIVVGVGAHNIFGILKVVPISTPLKEIVTVSIPDAGFGEITQGVGRIGSVVSNTYSIFIVDHSPYALLKVKDNVFIHSTKSEEENV
jgi:hypothetical protein